MLKEQKNSKIQANVGIGLAIGYFARNGITVCIPLTDSQEYDLVIDKEGIFKKVQVKTTYHKNKYGDYVVELRTWTHCAKKGYGRKSMGPVDYLFVVTEDDTYLIPYDDIGASKGLVLGKKYSKFKL